jgi:hypothetical protein
MNGTESTERSRAIAARLAAAFTADQELAERLNDAHSRLLAANDRLWSGLHPEGLAAGYGEHPEFEASSSKRPSTVALTCSAQETRSLRSRRSTGRSTALTTTTRQSRKTDDTLPPPSAS